MNPRYETEIDVGQDRAQARAIRLVGEHKRVLELGCATGFVSRVLVDRFRCSVVGVELDAEAAEEARKVCRRVIVADLEALDLRQALGDERFDVILCGDVLEHLRDPARVLASLRHFLRPEGYLVASIPNVAHASVVAELLHGRFDYRPYGLLDATHLRFFTREGVLRCFDEGGFVVSHLERVVVRPEDTELRTDLSAFPEAVAKLLLAGEESATYQFVLVARPGGASGAETLTAAVAREPALQSRTAAAAPGDRAFWQERLEGLIQALLGRIRLLEDERARSSLELGELRERGLHHDNYVRHLRQTIAGLEETNRRLAEERQRLEVEPARARPGFWDRVRALGRR